MTYMVSQVIRSFNMAIVCTKFQYMVQRAFSLCSLMKRIGKEDKENAEARLRAALREEPLTPAERKQYWKKLGLPEPADDADDLDSTALFRGLGAFSGVEEMDAARLLASRADNTPGLEATLKDLDGGLTPQQLDALCSDAELRVGSTQRQYRGAFSGFLVRLCFRLCVLYCLAYMSGRHDCTLL